MSESMVLAVLDDLMFMSKIRASASRLGVQVVIARTSQGALDQMRASAPALVIFDLSNPRADPLGTVAAMKADPALQGVRTLGFAGHTQTELLEAARLAGVHEVLTRGAFAERLFEVLSRVGSSAADPGAQS
jgi:PleD family two-component response regulator